MLPACFKVRIIHLWVVDLWIFKDILRIFILRVEELQPFSPERLGGQDVLLYGE